MTAWTGREGASRNPKRVCKRLQAKVTREVRVGAQACRLAACEVCGCGVATALGGWRPALRRPGTTENGCNDTRTKRQRFEQELNRHRDREWRYDRRIARACSDQCRGAFVLFMVGVATVRPLVQLRRRRQRQRPRPTGEEQAGDEAVHAHDDESAKLVMQEICIGFFVWSRHRAPQFAVSLTTVDKAIALQPIRRCPQSSSPAWQIFFLRHALPPFDFLPAKP